MAHDTSQHNNTPEMARQQVRSLLASLIAERDQLEAMMEESGRRDHMKWITGRSAMDTAIERTRELLGTLEETPADTQHTDGVVCEVQTKRISRALAIMGMSNAAEEQPWTRGSERVR